jgi:hypothetical protein
MQKPTKKQKRFTWRKAGKWLLFLLLLPIAAAQRINDWVYRSWR